MQVRDGNGAGGGSDKGDRREILGTIDSALAIRPVGLGVRFETAGGEIQNPESLENFRN
jgi:hypothetical protein